MRLAICLSGQPRTWRHTRDSLLAFFAGHDVDVFLHTWHEGDPAELEALIDAYRPRGTQIEDRPLFVAEKRQLAERYPASPPLGMFDMFHSIAGSLALAAEADQIYDLVVRARFDTLFNGAWAGEAPPGGMLVVPDLYPYSSGCTDQFALGRPADMAVYAGISAWLGEGAYPAYPERWIQPERVLRHYLETARGLRVEIRSMAMKLLRENQVGRPFAAVTDDPLFHAQKHEDWEAFAAERFPDVAAEFDHVSRTPLGLERALAAWRQSRPQKDSFRLLKAPWSQRIAAVDAFIRDQAGEIQVLDEASYSGVRLICALLLQHMDPAEPMVAESWIVHALSANADDMQRAHDWVAADAARLDRLGEIASRLGPLTLALTFANPLEQAPIGLWRPR